MHENNIYLDDVKVKRLINIKINNLYPKDDDYLNNINYVTITFDDKITNARNIPFCPSYSKYLNPKKNFRFEKYTILTSIFQLLFLSKASDIFIDISVEQEACPLGKAPTASTTVTLAVGDALAMCLLEKRGFTEEDFLIFHPSGALGKGFTYKVSDLMRTKDLPVEDEDKLFTDVIETISEHKLGLALIVDAKGLLTGILTDGDIRRNLIKYKDVSNLKVVDAMTKSPKTVKADSYAASALHLMEKYSITALPIVNEVGEPVGVVHIHDLLKAGVV